MIILLYQVSSSKPCSHYSISFHQMKNDMKRSRKLNSSSNAVQSILCCEHDWFKIWTRRDFKEVNLGNRLQQLCKKTFRDEVQIFTGSFEWMTLNTRRMKSSTFIILSKCFSLCWHTFTIHSLRKLLLQSKREETWISMEMFTRVIFRFSDFVWILRINFSNCIFFTFKFLKNCLQCIIIRNASEINFFHSIKNNIMAIFPLFATKDKIFHPRLQTFSSSSACRSCRIHIFMQ